MKATTITILLNVIIFISSSAASTPQDSALYDYNNKNYPDAIEKYTRIEKNGAVSDALYYNLGNSYYRNGQKGKAVLNYERALKINPRNEHAKANLDFVRMKLTDESIADENILIVTIRNVRDCISVNAWTIIGMVAFVAFMVALALYVFSANILVKKTGFFGGIGLLLLCIAANIFATNGRMVAYDHSYAIVVKDSTILSTVARGPLNKQEIAFVLHEGAKVEKVDSLLVDKKNDDKWFLINTIDNRQAWIQSSAIEEI